jgi:hypothetical protein
MKWHPMIGDIIRPGLCLTNVFRQGDIRNGFLTERGYEIVVDGSGRPALPVEIGDN